ncbi:hypothetical protein [Sphingomonas sp.]|uniref:hypothetical protein n=1 Tax=Sphingomonas sp. TaxID=28214 RepID=UPI000DB719BA|nr:hypothetical protein [Sphingomonas sp.]PZU09786.1 MAG: hypothetical protein DI605_09140 [Sphingomonas sp.]
MSEPAHSLQDRHLRFTRALGMLLLLGLCVGGSALRPTPNFTGASLTAARSGGGWDFAPVPGVRVGVDAERLPARGAAAREIYLGGRVGAKLGRSTLVYVRAGYASPVRRAARRPDGRIRVALGLERLAAGGRSVRTEARYDSDRTMHDPQWRRDIVTYDL